MEKSVKIRLRFTPADTERPFVHLLATRFGLVFSILQADISPDKGGRMVLDLSGEETAIADALKFTASTEKITQNAVRINCFILILIANPPD